MKPNLLIIPDDLTLKVEYNGVILEKKMCCTPSGFKAKRREIYKKYQEAPDFKEPVTHLDKF
jgi:hypothetical protein